MRKNGKTNAVGRGGALLRPAGYTELSKIFGESVCTYPRGRRGRCPHRPGRMHRFYGNLRRICTFSMGRQSRRPLQQPFALSVGEDDSVRPRDVPILRESSANSQLPPTSKEVTACGFAANSRRNSLHSAGRAEPRPYQLRLHFNGFCVKQTVYGLKLMTLPLRGSWLRSEAEQTDEGTGQFRFAVKFQQFDTSPHPLIRPFGPPFPAGKVWYGRRAAVLIFELC